MPVLPTDPLRFKPTGRYTQEHKDKFDQLNSGFLWPAERDLLHYCMMIYNDAFTWETSEQGHFQEAFFPLVDIPVVPHKPWVHQTFQLILLIQMILCTQERRQIALHSPIARTPQSSHNCTLWSTPIH